MEVSLIILTAATFIVVLLTFLAFITPWFKQSIPIQFGFLINNKIVEQLELTTGDVAKSVILRFHNRGKSTMTGLILDIRFYRPLAISGTEKALSFLPGKTTHGRPPDNSYYLIRYSELEMVGEQDMDFRVELNTQNKAPGTYKVAVTAYSTQLDYKYKKAELSILMR